MGRTGPTAGPMSHDVSQDGETSRRVALTSLLFAGHASCSIFLVLINKTISMSFPFPWAVVFIQNSGTILCSVVLHLLGRVQLQPLRRHQVVPLVIDSFWLVVVLWSSIKALQEVTVPLYVVVRNTVPFLTALCEWVCLGQPLDFMLFIALLATFAGTALYSVSDFDTPLHGLAYAVANAVLVSGMCVYERYLMTSSKVGMTALDLNFHRVLLSMPCVVILVWLEGFPDSFLQLPGKPREAAFIAVSALAAFSIGTLLLKLQGEVSATTIQVANVAYKCATTAISRLTHPAEVSPLGYVGYGLCTSGVLLYTLTRRPRAKGGAGKKSQ